VKSEEEAVGKMETASLFGAAAAAAASGGAPTPPSAATAGGGLPSPYLLAAAAQAAASQNMAALHLSGAFHPPSGFPFLPHPKENSSSPHHKSLATNNNSKYSIANLASSTSPASSFTPPLYPV